jgi:hypothetical protein
MDTATTTAAPRVALARPHFFARSALVMLALVLSAFPLTYFGPTVTGSRPFPPVYHIHGIVFFAWMSLYAWQTRLVATGRVARHRELGLAGVALSALMIPLGILLTIAAIQRRTKEGNPHPFDNALYNVVDLTSFAVLMIASIACVTRHADWHRRFTYAAALALVGPAISRWFYGPWFISIPEAPPFTDFAPNLCADLFFVPLMLHDRRTLGRIHPATLWPCLIMVPLHVLTPFATGTAWWRALAPAITKLG